MITRTCILGSVAILAWIVSSASTGWAGVKVTNLITDNQAVNAAPITDPDLVNPWGITFSGGSPFWVSDNGTGKSTLYTVNPVTNIPTKAALTITIPGDGTATGDVFSGTTAFNSDTFLFVSEDGTVSGWRGALGTTAEVLTPGSTANVYKGSALDVTLGNSYLLAANFKTGNIDVFKGSGGAPDLVGKFVDPNLPAGYAPFDVANLGGKIFVTYALQDAAKHDDVAGPGHGFVAAYDLNGNLLAQLVTAGKLNSPWGLTLAPTGFQNVGGDLLIGNFGDGTIDAFNLSTNSNDGQIQDTLGNPLQIDGLWGLTTGNGGNGGSPANLYFSAGPNGETDGLFGTLSVPEPTSMAGALLIATALTRRRHRTI